MVEVPVCPSPVAPGISASVPQYTRPTEGPEGQRPAGGSAARCPWILLFFPPNAIFLSQEPPRIEPSVPWGLRLLAFRWEGTRSPPEAWLYHKLIFHVPKAGPCVAISPGL